MRAVHRSGVDLALVKFLRKSAIGVGIVVALAVVIFGESVWPGGHVIHETIEWVGIALIALCVLGRTWCAIYIGGRKSRDLMRVGPYSVSRNPLYLFSILGATGAGAQLASLVVAFAAGFAAWLLYFLVVRKEESVLAVTFGAPYREYLATVPRFLPNPRLWQDVKKMEVRPSIIVRTFADATLFLLAIPLAEWFEHLHRTGMLPVLFVLP